MTKSPILEPINKKKWIPCTCPKGGVCEYENGHTVVCDKCGGTEWIKDKLQPICPMCKKKDKGKCLHRLLIGGAGGKSQPIEIELAILFHNTYEKLAPSFGYETRTETKIFNPDSPNGKLMIAVCKEILSSPLVSDKLKKI